MSDTGDEPELSTGLGGGGDFPNFGAIPTPFLFGVPTLEAPSVAPSVAPATAPAGSQIAVTVPTPLPFAPSPADVLQQSIEATTQAPPQSLVDLAIEQSNPSNLLEQSIENTVQQSLPPITVRGGSLEEAGLTALAAVTGAAGTVVGGIAYGLGAMFDYAAKPRRGEIPIRSDFGAPLIAPPPIEPPSPAPIDIPPDLPIGLLPDISVTARRREPSPAAFGDLQALQAPFLTSGLPFGGRPAAPRGSPSPRRPAVPLPRRAAGPPFRIDLPVVQRRPRPPPSAARPPAPGPLQGGGPLTGVQFPTVPSTPGSTPTPGKHKKPAPETRKEPTTETSAQPECPGQRSTETKKKYGCEQGYYRETETGIIYKKWSTRKCPSSKVNSRLPQPGRPITS